MPSALAAAARFPEFDDAYRAFLIDRRAPMLAAVERGVERGELRPDVDPDVVVDLVVGPIYYRSFTTKARLGDDDLAVLVDEVVAAFSRTPAS